MNLLQRRWLVIFALLAFVLPGCQGLSPSQPGETRLPPLVPIPTPEVVAVVLPPLLEPVAPALRACSQENPTVGVVVYPSLAHANTAPVDLTFSWGEDENLADYSAAVGEEHLVVIVHPEQSASQFTLQQVIAIFTGEQTTWPGTGEEIHVWAPPTSDLQWQLFEQAAGASIPPTGSAAIAGSAEMRAAIAADPAAIGLLPSAWLDDEVKALPLTGPGFSPLPILVSAPQEPQGAGRLLLYCLQSGAGQPFLTQPDPSP